MPIERLNQNSNRLIDPRQLRQVSARIRVPDFASAGESIRRSTLQQLGERVADAREKQRKEEAEVQRVRRREEAEARDLEDYNRQQEISEEANKVELVRGKDGQLFLSQDRPEFSKASEARVYDRIIVKRVAQRTTEIWKRRINEVSENPDLTPEQRQQKIEQIRQELKTQVPEAQRPDVEPLIDEFAVRAIDTLRQQEVTANRAERLEQSVTNVEASTDSLAASIAKADEAERITFENQLRDDVRDFVLSRNPNIDARRRDDAIDRFYDAAITNANVIAFRRVLGTQLASPSLNEVQYVDKRTGQIFTGAQAVERWGSAVKAGGDAVLVNAPVIETQRMEDIIANPHSRAALELRQDIDRDYLLKITGGDDNKINQIAQSARIQANEAMAIERQTLKRVEMSETLKSMSQVPGGHTPPSMWKKEMLSFAGAKKAEVGDGAFFSDPEVQQMLAINTQTVRDLPEPVVAILVDALKNGNEVQVADAVRFISSDLSGPTMRKLGNNVSQEIMAAIPDVQRAEIQAMVTLWGVSTDPKDFLSKRQLFKSKSTPDLNRISGLMMKASKDARLGFSSFDDMIIKKWSENVSDDRMQVPSAIDRQRIKAILPIILRSMEDSPDSFETQVEALELAVNHIASTLTTHPVVGRPMRLNANPFAPSVADEENDLGHFDSWAKQFAHDHVTQIGEQAIADPEFLKSLPRDSQIALKEIIENNGVLNSAPTDEMLDETTLDILRIIPFEDNIRLMPKDDRSMTFEIEIKPSNAEQWRPLVLSDDKTAEISFGAPLADAVIKAEKKRRDRLAVDGQNKRQQIEDDTIRLQEEFRKFLNPEVRELPLFNRAPGPVDRHGAVDLEDATDFSIQMGVDDNLQQLSSVMQASIQNVSSTASEAYREFVQSFATNEDEMSSQFKNIAAAAAETREVSGKASAVRPADLTAPYVKGPVVMARAAKEVDNLMPDGSGGLYLFAVSRSESDYGRHPSTWRIKGDVGALQLNTSTGFKDTKAKIREHYRASPSAPLTVFNERFKKKFGFDLREATVRDTYKPVVAMGLAKAHTIMMRGYDPEMFKGASLRKMAKSWKIFYNSRLGAGTVSGFINSNKGTAKLYESLING